MEVGFAMVDHGGVHRLVGTQHVVSLAALPSQHSALLDGPVSVVLTSQNPNGSSHRFPVELGRDESYLYIAADRGQVVDRNLRARPDVSFLLVDPADPYRWMDVTAHAEQVLPEAGDRHVRHGGLTDQLGLLKTGHTHAGSGGDARAKESYTLYRARPDRLTLFEKRRPA